MSKKNDLKAAMKRLKVHEPLKLKEPDAPTRKEAPRIELPQTVASNVAKNEATQSELTKPKGTKHEKTRIEESQTEKSCTEPTPREVASLKLSQDEAAQNESALIEEVQDELPQSEIPPEENATPVRGFFKLAHSVFEDPRLREISGDCFRLYLWFSSRAWRFPQSNGTLRASVRFIQEGTGIPHATVSRCLSTLKEKKLIKLLESNYKKGNRWYISKYAVGDGGPPGGHSQSELPHIEEPQDGKTATSIRGSSSLNTRKHLPQNGSNIRSFNKTKTLQKRRTSRGKKATTCGRNVCIPVAAVATHPDEESNSIEDFAVALTAFESDLDDARKNTLIDDYSNEKFPHGFLPPENVVRRLAAMDWFQEHDGSRYPIAQKKGDFLLPNNTG